MCDLRGVSQETDLNCGHLVEGDRRRKVVQPVDQGRDARHELLADALASGSDEAEAGGESRGEGERRTRRTQKARRAKDGIPTTC